MVTFEVSTQEIANEYLDFLDDEEDQGVYHRRVKDMIDGKGVRLLVNINDLRKKKPERAKNLLTAGSVELGAFQEALKEYIHTVDPTCEIEDCFIGLEGSFGRRHVTPRTLSSRFLNNLICLEGIATQCSLVKPKLVTSVHYCPATSKISKRNYTDLTSLNPVVTAPMYPTQDDEGNILETEFGLSKYKDHQTLIIQEMPEKAPAGQLPRSVDVICDNDLADKCKPGDRVQIVGIYRCLPDKRGGFTTGVFRTVLLANNISLLNKETKLAMSRKDVANCRKFAKKKNIFELLSRSLAPSIHGNDYVKKALLCMLLGGVEKLLLNGSRLRGDINILLIGDPSVAKSQLLRYVLCTAPRAIATTGRGCSGVGLTAAVTTDQETGDRRLEAGAMVLADRGIVCIDEFDKMSDIDRTAIHEVMEQGRVTIAKAGIHARLNARCSVLAAANPVYGKYDQYKPPMENIGLQDSLLSRFDLLFVMLDIKDNEADARISDHVVRMHRYRSPQEQDGEVLAIETTVDYLTTNGQEEDYSNEDTPVFEKYDPLLHGNSRSKTERIFTVRFMRMYLHIAKTLKPTLTDEGSALIAEEYARLRSQDAIETGVARTQPVTVRTLETLIRLATAHAKARFSCNVELEDAQAAIELVQYAYFKKVLEKTKKRRRPRKEGDVSDLSGEEDEHDDDEDDAGENDSEKTSQPVKRRKPSPDETIPTEQEQTSQEVHSEPMETSSVESDITPERLTIFRQHAASAFQEARTQSCKLSDLITKINSKVIGNEFTQSEVTKAISIMSNENQVMVSEDVVYLI
ncbi:DNA replication licensing factor Mcm3 [Halyomorpha halys]|uniref:DNA replication licensing factor Mcm3 n=1 Tax=Halyomorpha halys TaxID=286706 RepID=UPI0006D51327|nr:DNA replication licensing factor Mcm3 [Halyomorpha halys]